MAITALVCIKSSLLGVGIKDILVPDSMKILAPDIVKNL
jgi:hypothetical protein